MKKKRALSVSMALLMLASTISLMGCGSSKKDYDVYIYNTKSEIADSYEKLASEYEKETGIKVKVLTSGTDTAMETLRSEVTSKDYPTIFSCNASQVKEWVEGKYATDAAEIENTELKALYESIPDSMKLTSSGSGNYGIPYSVEGYGLIANKNMIKDILGLDNADGFIADYKVATYDEVAEMVKAMDEYIKGTGAINFTLNGNTYTTASEKTDLTKSLNGVFAIAGAEKWTYGNHYSNYALNAVFNTYDAAINATKEQVEALREPLKKSLLELGEITNYTAGPEGALTRGSEYINSTVSSYDIEVQTFSQGKAIFIKQGNWIYSNVAGIDQTVADNLCMLPVKLNFDKRDIAAENMTVEKMNQSVSEFVSQYYIVNEKASSTEKKNAEDFLVWLYTSDTGKDYILNQFEFVPFNADSNTNLTNPLSIDLISYKNDGNVLSNCFDAVPNSWGVNAYGKVIMENLLTNPDKWSDSDIDAAVDECINYWNKNLK